jgi:hypothetical protein
MHPQRPRGVGTRHIHVRQVVAQSINPRRVCWRGNAVRSPSVRSRMVAQTLGDLLHRHGAHARRGKFQRQRNAIQPPTDIGNGTRVLPGDLKGRLDGGCPVDEQTHSLVSHDRFGSDRRACVGNRQGGHWIGGFGPHAGLAGSSGPSGRAHLQQFVDELGAGFGRCSHCRGSQSSGSRRTPTPRRPDGRPPPSPLPRPPRAPGRVRQ